VEGLNDVAMMAAARTRHDKGATALEIGFAGNPNLTRVQQAPLTKGFWLPKERSSPG